MKQLSKEWFEIRKEKITGSVAGAILGLDPWRTPEDIMRVMVRDYHGADREWVGNIATEYGKNMEALAKADYSMQRHPVTDCGFFISDEYPWLGATPDGLVGDNAIIEIKCPYGLRNELNPIFKTIDDQPHYYVQIQVELFVTKREWCNFYQWSPNGDYHCPVAINKDWLDENIPKLKAFYDKYLIEREHPARYLETKRREIDTMYARKLIYEYQQLGDAIALVTERKKEVLQEIVSMAGERDSLVCGHNLTKVEKQGAIAYAQVVKKLLPGIDLEPWRGQKTEYWVLK